MLASAGCDCGGGLAFAPGAVGVRPTALDFGEVEPHQTSERTIKIFNQGSSEVILHAASIVEDDQGAFALVDDLPPRLARGFSVVLRVRFAPREVGARSARLEIDSNADNAPTLTISLTGRGAAALADAGTDAGIDDALTDGSVDDANSDGGDADLSDGGDGATVDAGDAGDAETWYDASPDDAASPDTGGPDDAGLLDAAAPDACPPSIRIEDVDFPVANWQATVSSFNGPAMQSVTRELAGGDPGPFRRMTHFIDAPPNGPATTIVVLHIYLGATIDPAALGGIASIEYSESRIMFSGPGAIGARAMLVQDGTLYYSTQPLDFSSLAWTTVTVQATPSFGFTNSAGGMPDFSPSGAPITLGFIRSNSNGAGPETKVHGIDNWSVVVVPACR